MADPVSSFLNRGFGFMARRNLRGIWTRGRLPAGPFVWAANHHCWWDPFLAAVVLEKLGRQLSLLMLQENMAQYGFTRRLGVFGSEEPRRGLDYLRAGRALVIFPEGGLRPAGPLGPAAGGAAWFAAHAPAPLVAVACRVVVRGHQSAEAYLNFEQVDSTGPVAAVADRVAARLGAGVADLDGLLARTDPRTIPPGFLPALQGRRSVDERIDRFAARFPWTRH